MLIDLTDDMFVCLQELLIHWQPGHFLWCTYLFFNGLILWMFSLTYLPIFQWLESMDIFFDMLNTLIIFSLVLLWHLYLIYLTFLMHLSFSETLAWYYLNILFDMLNYFLAHLSFSEILAWCYLNILFDVLSFFCQWALMGLMILGHLAFNEVVGIIACSRNKDEVIATICMDCRDCC